jgi:hypothetical protein
MIQLLSFVRPFSHPGAARSAAVGRAPLLCAFPQMPSDPSMLVFAVFVGKRQAAWGATLLACFRGQASDSMGGDTARDLDRMLT